MWITEEVELPQGLLKAQREGNLVVFAGAGISTPHPTSIPTFADLANRVSAEAGGTWRRYRSEPVDRFLGRMEREDVPVHQMVADVILDPESKPNPLHEAIISLFESPNNIRIVTTNFDGHLSKVASDSMPIYYAPALPVGQRFVGIVYLHGCVDNISEQCVITDSDFGRAYLTEGWATQFLKELFLRFTVLFVGYSHNDPVMNYLRRGLALDKSHFAFTREGKEEIWQFLNIEPVSYPIKRGRNSHRALYEALRRWSYRIRMGPFDHEERIRTTVSLPPPVDEETADYIDDCLNQTSTARYFSEYAQSEEWLDWASRKTEFRRLFDPHEAVNDVGLVLANWFAEKYVCQHTGSALALISDNGQNLNPALWEEIARILACCDPPPHSTILSQWIPLLLRTAPEPESRSNSLEYILNRCSYPEDKDSAILLFTHLSTPRLVVRRHFTMPDEDLSTERIEAEIAIPADVQWMHENWGAIFQPNLPEFSRELSPILTQLISQAYLLMKCMGKADSKWDPVSWRRSAIEPHEQDDHRHPMDILIDAARDTIEWLVQNDTDQALLLIESWSKSEVPLLRRLAIHAIRRMP